MTLQPSAPVAAAAGPTVEFRRSGVRAAWTDAADSLLELAESCGLTPDFSCRSAVCGTCRARLVSGEVAYFEPPLSEPAEGEILLCCSRPVGSVVIDI